MEANPIKRVLIANRGEIAVRIIRACREMGIESVAICSDVDKEALHAQLADEAICIGPYKLKESYLSMERILSAAYASGADAIHPGFGFLSENAEFAKRCKEAGIEFIGPTSDMMDKLGDKIKSKIVAKSVGVPVIPGVERPIQSEDEAVKFAEECGYPVMLKAAAGGGGRGMRIVRHKEELLESFRSAKNESKKAFGNDDIFIEKYMNM